MGVRDGGSGKEFTGINQKKKDVLLWAHNEKKCECLEKEIMQGTVPGARARGKPRKRWMDNVGEWLEYYYQRKGCCVKPRTGEDGEESSTMRPTLVSRTVEERERE